MRNDNFTTRGLGFIQPKNCQCKVCNIIAYIKVETKSNEEDNFYEVNLANGEEVEVKPTPNELEDGGQTTTMHELNEANLVIEDDTQPTFISAILSDEKVE